LPIFSLAVAFSIPGIAATLGIITYALAGGEFTPSIVFPSLALYQLLRQPLIFLPRALSATADAKNALARLQDTFHAELMENTGLPIEKDLPVALDVKDATFQWEQTAEQAMEVEQKFKSKGGRGGPGRKPEGGNKAAGRGRGTDGKNTPAIQQTPFSVKDLNMKIPRGKLHAIVGSVGSGKTSVLSGLLGDMKTTKGSVRFGGQVAYCSQIAWIQNATVVSTIRFSMPLAVSNMFESA
jgi:ATP-binding cassette subfamily C (CFTR/MRP) protein 1